MCDCNEQENVIDITNNHKAFQNGLIALDFGNWEKLMECSECGQLWKVSEFEKYQTLYAVKVPDLNDWEDVGDALIKEKIVQDRGGITEQECMFSGCEHKQVKDSAYCIDHLYETGTGH
ncbi:metal-binding protein [Psychromonas algicola]|uniref:metal-binding protein n=1 Tax=Psychromonas algicola TaxID=2555642 RepID=UPI001067424A|nr:metal-binding protein [Psychromonas sp. RZ5]TEW47648.1 metal-binding protein [Psychromonas sp. RZ5]